MKIEKKNMDKNLPKKGFVRSEAHHIYFHHHYDGKDTGVYTYISHGSKRDFSGHIVTKIRKQLKLDSSKEALDLINCPMDEDTYNQILRDKGYLP